MTRPARLKETNIMRLARFLALFGAASFLTIGFVVIAPTALAATITVNTLDEELNTDADCAFREAIEAANKNAAVDSCPAGQAAPTIDVITFSVTGTITVFSTLPIISEALIVRGPGASSLTISGGNAVRVMEIGVGAELELERVTIADGRTGTAPMIGGAGVLNAGTLFVTDTTFSGNFAGFGGVQGGAIGSAGGIVDIATSTFSGNSSGGDGGAIYSEGGSVTVSDSVFSGNSTNELGGAIYAYSGALTVENTTFTGNTTDFNGGAVASRSATALIGHSTFSDNTAGLGGAIYNGTGTMTIGTSTLSGNSATFSAGGGIFNSSGMLTVTSATLSGNSSNLSGGGIFNGTGTVTLKNTIVANSTSGGNCSGPITDSGGNLSWPDATCPGTNVDPLFDLSGLRDNGGPTATIALQAGSPAIDGGSATCGSDDQRGVERPQGLACDNGAFEMPKGVAGVIVDPQPTLGSTGRVTVRGEILCGPTGDSFALLVRVDQSSTGAVTKIGLFQGICSGDPNDAWANRPPKKQSSPAFQPGPARVCVQARTYAGSTETDRVTFCNNVTLVTP